MYPRLFGRAGGRAQTRFWEFFVSNIRNPHTRRAYARAVQEFVMAVTLETAKIISNTNYDGTRSNLTRQGLINLVRFPGGVTANGYPTVGAKPARRLSDLDVIERRRG
jgi:hypothetical protein